MFKSKHSGWTWDLKRTPFGGGGGWTDPIDWSGAGDALASIDPGPAVGQGLAEVDKTVANVIPGGWETLGTAVATYFGGPLGAAFAQGVAGTAKGEDWDKTLADMGKAAALAYVGGELTEGLDFSGAEQITTESGKETFFQSLANGSTSADAISNGLAADAVASGAGTVTADGIPSGGDFTPAPGSNANFNIDPNATYIPSNGANIGSNGINAALQGPTYQELGITGVEGGLQGPTYGELGYTGLNQNEAIAAADAASQSGLSAADVLKNANRLKTIAKLLTGSESSPIYGKNTPTANQWATQAAQNFAQATPEQFGGYYQMNKNPFTFANPLASALKGNANGLDVSGTGGTTLQSQNLAKLLA
jgi:hypothetical protein